ncbi:MAG: hypothetical protein ACKO37_08975 [Vampirovibrionales bacterium]
MMLTNANPLTHTPVILQPPGAGVPFLERFFGGIGIRISAMLSTPEQCNQNFHRAFLHMLELIHMTPQTEWTRPVLVPRFQGLEDSSRYWSICMVLNHLNQVNLGTLKNIQHLVQEQKPNMTVRIEDVKPPVIQETLQATQVLQTFKEACETYLQEMTPLAGKLKTHTTLAHPWFGELNAHQWHFMMGFHMQLHGKQVQAIVNGLT